MKHTFHFFPHFVLWVFLFSCGQQKQADSETSIPTPSDGRWRGAFQLAEQEIPFEFDWGNGNGNTELTLINGEERLTVHWSDISHVGDSMRVNLHVFDTELWFLPKGNVMNGFWIKNLPGQDYRIPFMAELGKGYRFHKAAATAKVGGKWAVTFYDPEGGNPEEAVGIFRQEGEQVFGTFLTSTGDYRFLAGNVDGNTLQLSCFDGEHAFLFKAEIEGDTLLNGEFWSGKHWFQKWEGVRNEEATLPDAESLTFLKEGYETLSFEFPDLEGKNVSLTDEKFKDKVVLVQLLGSWCPNCMDETKFLAAYYEEQKKQDQPFEIIGLAYERFPEFDKAVKRVKRMQQRIGVDYELLIAGTNDKVEAAKTLPMLNHVLAFPTTIFIDKTGKVRKIHTGFSGPGTGEYYVKFREDFERFVGKLLAE